MGRIPGFDEYVNLVINEAEEIMAKKKTRRAIGRILPEGDTFCLMMSTWGLATVSPRQHALLRKCFELWRIALFFRVLLARERKILKACVRGRLRASARASS